MVNLIVLFAYPFAYLGKYYDQLHHVPDPTPNGEHYKPFEEIYGTETSEKHLPSLKAKAKESHGMPFSPSAQTARLLVLCTECLKPRVLYSKQKLIFNEEEAVQRSIESILYSCGSTLKGLQVQRLPTDQISFEDLFDRVFVRENISCDDCIEIPYYSSYKFEDICIYCACQVQSVDLVNGQYPHCKDCKELKPPVLKRKRKCTSE